MSSLPVWDKTNHTTPSSTYIYGSQHSRYGTCLRSIVKFTILPYFVLFLPFSIWLSLYRFNLVIEYLVDLFSLRIRHINLAMPACTLVNTILKSSPSNVLRYFPSIRPEKFHHIKRKPSRNDRRKITSFVNRFVVILFALLLHYLQIQPVWP